MGFQQGLSGLNVSAKNLDVIGNNVANSNTVGFKSSRTEFADIFASSISTTFSYTTSVSDIEWRNVEESNILSAKPRPPVRFSIRELNPKLFREQKNDLWKRMEKTVAWKELVTTISAFFIKPKNSFGPALA